VDGLLTGDRELMEYAFYNLLTNAVKYSPSGTHISVNAELPRKRIAPGGERSGNRHGR